MYVVDLCDDWRNAPGRMVDLDVVPLDERPAVEGQRGYDHTVLAGLKMLRKAADRDRGSFHLAENPVHVVAARSDQEVSGRGLWTSGRRRRQRRDREPATMRASMSAEHVRGHGLEVVDENRRLLVPVGFDRDSSLLRE